MRTLGFTFILIGLVGALVAIATGNATMGMQGIATMVAGYIFGALAREEKE